MPTDIDKNKDTRQDVVTVYQLKVTLRDVSPMIWRRVLVTSDTTIAQLHPILQTVMGWEDLHLHQFRIHGRAYGIYRDGGISFPDDPHQVKLRDFKLRKGERFVYEYDFGDFWQHDIRLEQVLPLEPKKKYPTCIDGDGDCPPENCGGPEAFMELIAERCSWSELSQAREDILLVAQRLRDFCQGGPGPTDDDEEFVLALERINERLEDAPIPFDRRAVNAALRKLRKETLCTSESK